MGIPGIYNEIGKGTRIALAKLAAQKFEQSGRPLRIAIDTAIWLVQIQSAKGGTNPALRTFYYRLLRLLSLSIDPLFVFDGPKKPKCKRNKQTGPNVATVPEFLAQRLLDQFGFPWHAAPGEAEAECALLQKSGIVDMVMSEDVDTLMFGSKILIRNFSAEGKGKIATHVNLFDAEQIKAGASGLDSEGMILVAMMSGGDYDPEGIPNCGQKIACEAARAGYGKRLCEVINDKKKLEEWKLDLAEELRTNRSKYFRTKHGSLHIPHDWPSLKILNLYMFPATSSPADLDRLRGKLSWDGDIDFAGLRKFALDAFKWQGKTGAKHFIRNLAQPMLVRQLRLRAQRVAAEMSSQKTTEQLEEEESEIVAAIYKTRKHHSTDEMPELRVGVVPSKLVPIDLDAEEEDDENSVADLEAEEAIAPEGDEGTAKVPTQYNPDELERYWALETLIKCGVPIKAEDWLEAQRKKNTPKEPKPQKLRKDTTKKPITKGGMPAGVLDRYTRIEKSSAGPSQKPARAKSPRVEQLDLSGFGDAPEQRNSLDRPAKATTKSYERTASAPYFINLCSSPPAAPEPDKPQSFSTMFDEHYKSPNITKRAKTLRRTQSANDSAPDEHDPLRRLGIQKAAAPPAEGPPSKRQMSIEESLRSWKRPSATLPSLDEIDQVDLTSSPVVPRRPALEKNHVASSTQQQPRPSSRAREALSPTSDNPTFRRATAKQPVATAKLSSVGRTSTPKSPGTKSKKPAAQHHRAAISSSRQSPPRIDRVFGSSKASKASLSSTEAPKKRAIKLRESLEGTWHYIERGDTEHMELTGSPQGSSAAGPSSGAANGATKAAKTPRPKAWRESGVEMLDLTDV